MEPSWLILVCAVVTHALLVLVLRPGYWSPLRRSGWQASNLVVPILMPVAFATILAAQILGHWRGLASPVLVLGGLGLGAATATVIVALARLRRIGA